MSSLPAATSSVVVESRRAGGVARIVSAFAELSKARLSLMVVITAGVGYLLAASRGAGDARGLVAVAIGVALSAFGANAFNQWIEVERDARMQRTRRRPLPAGDLSSGAALVFAALCSLVGPLVILQHANALAAGLALLTNALYVLAYTPLKPLSVTNTFVGAVVGALPPMIGWAAVSSDLAAGAWLLGGLLFVWQIPHFFALAWMYREDYARGGFRMLPTIDPSGGVTALLALFYAILLLPIGAGLAVARICGVSFLIIHTLLTLGLIALSVAFWRERSMLRAKRLFLGSIAYLPLILAAMALDRVGGAARG
ncbi:MAG: heme o synthase [Phycisphaerae bacterium]|nr:heme o synthase [Phycisphaerae bacterium]